MTPSCGAALVGSPTIAVDVVIGEPDSRPWLRRAGCGDAFKALWALSEPLAKYGRTGPASRVTPASLDALSNKLRHWYFAQGGMFLTETSRDAYFAFQEALQGVTQAGADEDGELDEPTRERIREKGSLLRDSLRAAFKGFPQM